MGHRLVAMHKERNVVVVGFSRSLTWTIDWYVNEYGWGWKRADNAMPLLPLFGGFRKTVSRLMAVHNNFQEGWTYKR